jgi:hypothetical protein
MLADAVSRTIVLRAAETVEGEASCRAAIFEPPPARGCHRRRDFVFRVNTLTDIQRKRRNDEIVYESLDFFSRFAAVRPRRALQRRLRAVIGDSITEHAILILPFHR